MTKSEKEATKQFMKKLDTGKLKKDTYPNSSPYYNGEKEEILINYENFIKSDIGKFIINIK